MTHLPHNQESRVGTSSPASWAPFLSPELRAKLAQRNIQPDDEFWLLLEAVNESFAKAIAELQAKQANRLRVRALLLTAATFLIIGIAAATVFWVNSCERMVCTELSEMHQLYIREHQSLRTDMGSRSQFVTAEFNGWTVVRIKEGSKNGELPGREGTWAVVEPVRPNSGSPKTERP